MQYLSLCTAVPFVKQVIFLFFLTNIISLPLPIKLLLTLHAYLKSYPLFKNSNSSHGFKVSGT